MKKYAHIGYLNGLDAVINYDCEPETIVKKYLCGLGDFRATSGEYESGQTLAIMGAEFTKNRKFAVLFGVDKEFCGYGDWSEQDLERIENEYRDEFIDIYELVETEEEDR